MRNIVLKIEHLTIESKQTVVVKDLSLKIHSGELIALVGASGSGKSVLAHGMLGFVPKNMKMTGTFYYEGTILTEEKRKKLLGNEFVLIPQNKSYLDPLMKAGRQVAKGSRNKQMLQKVQSIFARYALEESVVNKYPFMLSGGMTRRIFIASALLSTPKLVIADEPTPGLHKEMAEKVVSHFREIADTGAGVLMITHDLALALETADKVVVLYDGTVLEETVASPEKIRHPYTKALWKSMPQNGFFSLSQQLPIHIKKGCPFAEICKKHCIQEYIPVQETEYGFVKCLFPKEGSLWD